MIRSQWLSLLLAGLIAVPAALAIDLNIDDPNSLKDVAKQAATDMIAYYNGRASSDIPGKMDDTWWEGGAMFMTLIQYWYWTGDSQFNGIVQDGMYFQKGNDDYFPSNYSQYLGNDDQVFWGLAAMTAAELNFPEQDSEPSWLALAQGVFNTQVPRWDTSNCRGGMRWQIWPWQDGYTTKNAISNGGLFQLAARLARFTSNHTYADWAERIWDWSATTPLLSEAGWTIADTTSCASQCTDHGDFQWSYNYGTYISGAAYMYNHTDGAEKWKDGINGLWGTAQQFFPTLGFDGDEGNTMAEISCELGEDCDRNQSCFKAFFSTWLAFMTTLVPFTTEQVMAKLRTSAQGAAKQCTGGTNGQQCGRRWYQSTWDGTQGLEQQMSALGIFSASLVDDQQAPLTSRTGGTSKSNPGAGTSNSNDDAPQLRPITTGDQAGAGIVTVMFVAGWVLSVTWMIRGG
ncbi:CAZyme family GH76 [Penicillium lagena]|uniref:CAZyme family GH76 n=1 Tax=Penicillium lagena TaxID=94218 RepID=UPI002541BF2C|nr:CAZyme family GH76 [Penicillium lagena]KAJ5623862.1 CAZyme family GH76 [Penicillium lagena]